MTRHAPHPGAAIDTHRYLIDVGALAGPHGITLRVLLTRTTWADAVQWDRPEPGTTQEQRLAALLAALEPALPHVFRHPGHRHHVGLARILNRAPSGMLAHGILPTLVDLSIELGYDDEGAPVLIAGRLS